MTPWESWLIRLPVTQEIASSNLVGVAKKNVTSYDNGRVVLVNKPFFLQVEDKRTCIYDLVVELA